MSTEVMADDATSAEETVNELPMAVLWDLDMYPVVAPPAAG